MMPVASVCAMPAFEIEADYCFVSLTSRNSSGGDESLSNPGLPCSKLVNLLRHCVECEVFLFQVDHVPI